MHDGVPEQHHRHGHLRRAHRRGRIDRGLSAGPLSDALEQIRVRRVRVRADRAAAHDSRAALQIHGRHRRHESILGYHSAASLRSACR